MLNYDGCFVPGENVPISLTKALGGGTALLFLSAGQSQTPLPGTCTLHIAPAPVVVVTFPVGGTGPGNGVSFLTGTIPLAMPAASIYTQLLVLDPGAPAGFSATNGLRITVH
ncbi:MAG: hypothetical protein IPH13_08880 [Planctomycetes bacterium]|nr:hypothetical protein [Planctomycetota bacterium]